MTTPRSAFAAADPLWQRQMPNRLAGLGEALHPRSRRRRDRRGARSAVEAVARSTRRMHGRASYLAVAKEQDGDGAGALAGSAATRWPMRRPRRIWSADGAPRIAADRRRRMPAGTAIAALPRRRAAGRPSAAWSMGSRSGWTQGGGTLPEWMPLIRARVVLGDRPAALQAVKTARERLAQDAAALDAHRRLGR